MTVVRPFGPVVRHARDADVIVIGSGMAGMTAALRLAPRRVTLLTKTPALEGGSTAWAQGGIAAAVGVGDTPACHGADTMAAGAGLSQQPAVQLLTEDGAARVRELIAGGAPFDRDGAGDVLLGREAAHTHRRIVHAGGDATGRHIHRWLADAVGAAASIDVRTSAFAWDLVIDDGRVCGVLAYHDGAGWMFHRAPFVVLATGGSGQLFEMTTNPREATADGLAMAARAGAVLADLEFVQFHPTALADPAAAPGAPMGLMTEALRGEGATLVDAAGRRFMAEEHRDAELAPRDVVARAIWQRLIDGQGAFLDMRAIMRSAAAAKRFPTVAALCAAAGFDPARQPVPVAPAAHYQMGGVVTDTSGRTSLAGLWACGEVASTGVHGANRLASNSLLEGLVFGNRVADDIAASAASAVPPRTAPPVCAPAVARAGTAPDIAGLTGRLRRLMYQNVGLRRDRAGLGQALDALGAIDRQIARRVSASDLPVAGSPRVRPWGELRNLALAARLTALAAARRTESRGAHCRTDYPAPSAAVGNRQFLTVADLSVPPAAAAMPVPAAAHQGRSHDHTAAAALPA